MTEIRDFINLPSTIRFLKALARRGHDLPHEPFLGRHNSFLVADKGSEPRIRTRANLTFYEDKSTAYSLFSMKTDLIVKVFDGKYDNITLMGGKESQESNLDNRCITNVLIPEVTVKYKTITSSAILTQMNSSPKIE